MSRPLKLFTRLRRVPHTINHMIEATGEYAPWLFLALFIAASFLMIWRLEVMSGRIGADPPCDGRYRPRAAIGDRQRLKGC